MCVFVCPSLTHWLTLVPLCCWWDAILIALDTMLYVAVPFWVEIGIVGQDGIVYKFVIVSFLIGVFLPSSDLASVLLIIKLW